MTDAQIDRIMVELYDTTFVQKYAYSLLIDKSLFEDYLQECWVSIINWIRKNPDNAELLYRTQKINGIRRIASGIVNRTVKSDTSAAYMLLKRKDVNNICIKRDDDKAQHWDEINGWE